MADNNVSAVTQAVSGVDSTEALGQGIASQVGAQTNSKTLAEIGKKFNIGDVLTKAYTFDAIARLAFLGISGENAYEAGYSNFIQAANPEVGFKQFLDEMYVYLNDAIDTEEFRQNMNPTDFHKYVPRVAQAFYSDVEDKVIPVTINRRDAIAAFDTYSNLGSWADIVVGSLVKSNINYTRERFHSLFSDAANAHDFKLVGIDYEAQNGEKYTGQLATEILAVKNTLIQNQNFTPAGVPDAPDKIYFITDSKTDARMRNSLANLYHNGDIQNDWEVILDNQWKSKISTDLLESKAIGLAVSADSLRLFQEQEMGSDTSALNDSITALRIQNLVVLSRFKTAVLVMQDSDLAGVDTSRLLPNYPSVVAAKSYASDFKVGFDDRTVSTAESADFGLINPDTNELTKLAVGATSNLSDVSITRKDDADGSVVLSIKNISNKHINMNDMNHFAVLFGIGETTGEGDAAVTTIKHFNRIDVVLRNL